MRYFNFIFGKIFDIIFLPFRSLNPWVGMAVISFLTAILMLLVFRYTSDQKGILKVKNKIKAHLLEMRLYKDSLAVSLKAQGNILLTNLKYIGHSFKPLLVMIVPLFLTLIQLNFWFNYRALEPGQTALVKVHLKSGFNPMEMNWELQADPGLAVESPALRIDESAEVDWRIAAKDHGLHGLRIVFDGQILEKTVRVGQKPLTKISPNSVSTNFLDELFYPTDPPLPKDSPVRTIEVQYPEKGFPFLGLELPWWLVYFGLAIIFGFALKGVMGVEI